MIAKAKPGVVGARDYIGNSDGPAAGKRAGTEEWVRLFTTPTVIVYELILDNPTYGVIDALNVLG